jgi:hypothetical protein
LIYYVTPTEAELFSRYNPDLQRRSLENRAGKQEDFNKFVAQLKEYSKSDKPSMSLRLVRELSRSRRDTWANQRGYSLGSGGGSGRQEETGGRRERGAAAEKGVHGGASEEGGADEAFKGWVVQAVREGKVIHRLSQAFFVGQTWIYARAEQFYWVW